MRTSPGFGAIGEAMGGIRHTTGDPDRPPARAGISLGDALAALFAVIGTLAAVNERHASGRGQEVDVAIYEAVLALMESTVADFELGGVVRGRSGGLLPGVAPSNAYPTADGHDVVIAANADAVFARLATAMERPGSRRRRYATHAARAAGQLAARRARSRRGRRRCRRPRCWRGSSEHSIPVRADQHRARPRRRLHIAAARDMILRLAAGFDQRDADGRDRAEAVAHAGRGALGRPDARRAHRRGAARTRSGSTSTSATSCRAAGVIG